MYAVSGTSTTKIRVMPIRRRYSLFHPQLLRVHRMRVRGRSCCRHVIPFGGRRARCADANTVRGLGAAKGILANNANTEVLLEGNVVSQT